VACAGAVTPCVASRAASAGQRDVSSAQQRTELVGDDPCPADVESRPRALLVAVGLEIGDRPSAVGDRKRQARRKALGRSAAAVTGSAEGSSARSCVARTPWCGGATSLTSSAFNACASGRRQPSSSAAELTPARRRANVSSLRSWSAPGSASMVSERLASNDCRQVSAAARATDAHSAAGRAIGAGRPALVAFGRRALLEAGVRARKTNPP
jgi:hypothetical protein